MIAISPPECMHALNINDLRKPEITFWTVWDEQKLVGCGALCELDGHHGELKSMRTAATHHRKGVASYLLEHIINEAKRRGLKRISLETGSFPFFDPARKLYAKFGFRVCSPFAYYADDPSSMFMTRKL
jgi:putative acetyltransferase